MRLTRTHWYSLGAMVRVSNCRGELFSTNWAIRLRARYRAITARAPYHMSPLRLGQPWQPGGCRQFPATPLAIKKPGGCRALIECLKLRGRKANSHMRLATERSDPWPAAHRPWHLRSFRCRPSRKHLGCQRSSVMLQQEDLRYKPWWNQEVLQIHWTDRPTH